MNLLFKNHQFLRLWVNQILLQISFSIVGYAILLILAYRLHSPFVQAEFYTALTLPSIFFGLLAGVVADMTNRKKIMVITDILLALLFFAYAFINSSIVFILGIAFLTTSVARFFTPAEAATIPLIVEEKDLQLANALYLFTSMSSVLFGYTIAGPLIQAFGGLGSKGENIPFFLGTAVMVLGALLLVTFKAPRVSKLHLSGSGVVEKVKTIFFTTYTHITKEKRILSAMGLIIFVELNIGILSVIFLEYVHSYLKLPLVSISYYLMIPFIVGLGVGSYFLTKIKNKYGVKRSIYLACFAVGAMYLLFGLLPIFFTKNLDFLRLVTVLSSISLGISVVTIAVQSRTLLQKYVAKEMYGRVFSLLDMLIAVVTPIPVLSIGFLADKVDILFTLSSLGVIVMLVLFALYSKLFKSGV